ncbi:MAG: septum formation inhibitor Maf [Gammaproteobacteria bacterium]|nr:septum formation inhibitor Maf [Gammaproteobacteria bacterium]
MTDASPLRPCARTLVLASSSAYRRALLERLRLPFESASPDVDESRLAGETPAALVERLAALKARALAGRFPDALIIGSDQVAAVDGHVVGKPGDHATAARQLALASGRTLRFHTGVAVLDSRTGRCAGRLVTCDVAFRTLSPEQIEAYLAAEQPYDCAGSFKSELLGTALCTRITSDDPSALVGLPLIAVVDLFADHGLDVLLPSPR